MDEKYVQGLREAKALVDEGVFSNEVRATMLFSVVHQHAGKRMGASRLTCNRGAGV